MRLSGFVGILLLAFNASAQTSVDTTWKELSVKRELLPGLHQAFSVTRTFTSASGPQSSKMELVIDMAQHLWRETTITGSGTFVKIFNGKELFSLEADGNEFVRTKPRTKDAVPLPNPYEMAGADWSKAKELQRASCGYATDDHLCVVLKVPVTSPSTADVRSLTGEVRLVVDTENGLVLSFQRQELLESKSSGQYQYALTYALKKMTFGATLDANLFKQPSNDEKEVKELSRWNASKIKKQLVGKVAPELSVLDINGKPLNLSEYKGSIVLLDFWATWCPPCRADGPALDKLSKKYEGKDLRIIGISVSEDRAIVEQFLKEYPHSFPVVLTSENEMPRPYQIGVFPTYIVIGKDGTVTAAVEGDQGFSDLRRLLKKAGVETD